MLGTAVKRGRRSRARRIRERLYVNGMLCLQIDIGLPGVSWLLLPRSKSNWLMCKPFLRTQPASVGTVAARGIPFYNQSSASNVKGAEGVIRTPRPTGHFSLHRYSMVLVVSHSKSYILAKTGSVTALILLDEWRQLITIYLLCFT